MTNHAYKVDYHVIQAVYLQPTCLPSGAEFAQLWAATQIFGRHRVTGAFWRDGKKIPARLPRFELGSLEPVAPLLEHSSDPIFGGGTFAQKNVARDSTLDSDFYFTLSEASRWQSIETLPTFLMSVSGQWFEIAGGVMVLNVLKDYFKILDRSAPPYGFIDLSRSEDSFAGMAYLSTFSQRIPLHRWVEQGNWVYASSKTGDRARGIYWGNYFGPGILRRLGGKTAFVDRYTEQIHSAGSNNPNAHIWEFENGVFVSLCLDPLSCKPGGTLDFVAMLNLQWLHKELGEGGGLCGWSAPEEKEYSPANMPKLSHRNFGQAIAVANPTLYSELNDAERGWIRNCLQKARELSLLYAKVPATAVVDPAVLDQAFVGWLLEWRSGSSAEDTNSVVNATGLAFGQWLVDYFKMQWAVAKDVNGTDICVRHGLSPSSVTVFPTHVAAKALQSDEVDFFQKVSLAVGRQIGNLR